MFFGQNDGFVAPNDRTLSGGFVVTGNGPAPAIRDYPTDTSGKVTSLLENVCNSRATSLPRCQAGMYKNITQLLYQKSVYFTM
ncbi:MAG: hypothetical protein IJ551_09005 [Prevotella sp.]|nr:hypothetical protein [Prevotella sp.]